MAQNNKYLFLLNTYKKSKILFAFFVLFIIGQAFFTYKGVETLPFQNWGMYSGHFPERNTQQVMYLKVNDSMINLFDLHRRQRNTFQKTLNYYKLLKMKGFIDPNDRIIQDRFEGRLPEQHIEFIRSRISNTHLDQRVYQKWLHGYLEKNIVEKPIEKFQVGYFEYSLSDGKPCVKDTIPLISYDK